MNKRQLKTKPGPWYSAEQYVPAQPGTYRVRIHGIREHLWSWFDGFKFGLACFDQNKAILFARYYESGKVTQFRGLVKVGHEH
jgi:hypothetical protein